MKEPQEGFHGQTKPDLSVLAEEAFLFKYRCIWAASWQNQQNGMCAQRRLRSAWASAQSDLSLYCLPEESLGPQLAINCIKRTAKTLIRLGECPGWSESLLCAQIILLVLSCCGSIITTLLILMIDFFQRTSLLHLSLPYLVMSLNPRDPSLSQSPGEQPLHNPSLDLLQSPVTQQWLQCQLKVSMTFLT